MKNLKDTKTKIVPSRMRGGKELPSHSALDSPSILSKLATPPHAINPDMSQVIDDVTSTMNDAYDDASTTLSDNVPLADFLMNKFLEIKKMKSLKLMKYLKLKILKHMLDLALLDMNCLRRLKVMLWMRR